MSRFVTLAEVERRTGISANALRIRRHRGKKTPFPITLVEGLGLATTEEALDKYMKAKAAELAAQEAKPAA